MCADLSSLQPHRTQTPPTTSSLHSMERPLHGSTSSSTRAADSATTPLFAGFNSNAMNPPHPEPGLPRRGHHHHVVHLHLDPRHHHHVHIHLCCCHHHHHGGHLLAPAPPAHFHDNQQQHPAPVLYADTHPSAVLGQPDPPRAGVREDVEDSDPGMGLLHVEEAEAKDEEPVFVLTDEWAEFFAKSEAKRRLAKQQKKGRK